MPRDEIDKPPLPPATTAATTPPPLTIGDGALHPGRYNMAVVRKAIREGYPITDAIRQLVINQMALVVGRSDSEKNRIAASKVIVTADDQNKKRAELALRAEVFETDVDNGTNRSTVNVNITLEASKQQAELAALAAEIRSGRVVEGLFTTREAIDRGANGEAIDPSTQGSDGDH